MSNDRQKGRGALFQNTHKTGENHPDAKGTLRLPRALVEAIGRMQPNGDGEYELEIAAWNRSGPKAGRYLSLSVSIRPDRTQQAPSPQRTQASKQQQEGIGFSGGGDFLDDDIPF